MEIRFEELDSVVPLQNMLGYLDFSEGKPDARFQVQISDAYKFFAERGQTGPWNDLVRLLTEKLRSLQSGPSSAFEKSEQAAAVLSLVTEVLTAYRRHHPDLLFHHSDQELFQPFFLARVFEATLTQGGPWSETEPHCLGSFRKAQRLCRLPTHRHP